MEDRVYLLAPFFFDQEHLVRTLGGLPSIATKSCSAESIHSSTSMGDLYEEFVVVAVGMRHVAGPMFSFHPNHDLALEMEPENPHDAHAVKVIVRNQDNRHVAYIGKRHSKQVSDIISRGCVHRVKYEPTTSNQLTATIVVEGKSRQLCQLEERLSSAGSWRI